MTANRSYDQVCPIASALDAVGDRWALLVVRDLTLGPRRFGQLADGLPGIGTDILTARLRALERAGVVRRTNGARPSYELTAEGRSLTPVLLQLALWGAHLMRPPPSLDQVRPRLALSTLLLSRAKTPAPVAGSFELRTGEEVVHVEVRDGDLAILPVRADSPRATIQLSHEGLIHLLLGGRARDLVPSSDLTVRGDRRAARQLLDSLAAESPLGVAN